MKNYYIKKIIIILKNKIYNIFSLLYFIWISYRKFFSNKLKIKLNNLKVLVFKFAIIYK